ncbi:MAG TPA: TatD family hydrolase [Woeseiaceae bacterium]|nr:TatD family hydrolase [Woeseiaceae bacterium]
MYPLIDIGANLTHDSFDADRDAVIQRALSAGVERMILTGSSDRASHDAVALAEQRRDVFHATVGVHPHHASEYDDTVHTRLSALALRPVVAAIGECGLDYYRDLSPRARQRFAFERQIEIAIDTQLPLFLHQRDAHADFLAILKPAVSRLSRGVAHCFTGGVDELQAYLEIGLYIGVTGWICDERRGTALREAAPRIPLDRLMIETDAPYLLPRSLVPKPDSRRNEPMYLREVLRVLAETMHVDEDELARATTANSRRFFGI